MYCYRIYGKAVGINIPLPLLPEIETSGSVDLRVNVEYGEITGDIIRIKDGGKKYTVGLCSFAEYSVDPEENVIHCLAESFEAFFSTLFNIPFSVYFLCKNEILYHACTLARAGQVICLTGEKGVGKSTLMNILSREEGFNIFSDDTVHIGEGFIGAGAHNLIKQTPETVDALKLTTLEEKNIAGKSYIRFEAEKDRLPVRKIVRLVRCDGAGFGLRQVKSEVQKSGIFRGNVVGISHMPYAFINKVMKYKIPPEVEFYELALPNDLAYVNRNSAELCKLIADIF